MKSLQIVLIALVALVAAVASKRELLARVTLAAALAVTLLWMGGQGAQAGSFNPTCTWSVANMAADTPSDITSDFEYPEGDVLYSLMIRFLPTGWQITPSSDVDIGVQRGTADVLHEMGLLNNPCNTPIPMHWDTLNATTDKSQTVTYEDGFDDSNGDGNPDFVDMYPDFNDRILGPAQPFMREASLADLGEDKVLVQLLYYEAGATIAGQALDPALGYPVVNFAQNFGDPEAVPMPIPTTGMCTPMTGTIVWSGTAEDGTVLLKNPKEAGTYTFNSLFVGLRDADDDGHENTLDPCPLTADADWDPRAASPVGPGDADGDGLPSSCDPDDNDANADEDGDGYSNREDNCPLVANGVADADNQGDNDFDGIGDACDPNPDDADSEGEAPEASTSQDVTITEAPATPAVETPTPTVAPPATPVATPTPAVTPTPTPTPVIAPPPTGAGSASGTSWPWWPFAAAVAGAVAGAAAAAVGVLLVYQRRRAKP
jgi:hypothetical protein